MFEDESDERILCDIFYYSSYPLSPNLHSKLRKKIDHKPKNYCTGSVLNNLQLVLYEMTA